MKKILFVTMVVALVSCNTQKHFSDYEIDENDLKAEELYEAQFFAGKTKDYEMLGNEVVKNWHSDLNKKRKEFEKSKGKLKLYGAIYTGLGGLGSLIIPNLSEEDQKGGSIVLSGAGLLIGLFQILSTMDETVEQYYNDSYDVIIAWESAQNKNELEYKKLRKSIMKIFKKYKKIGGENPLSIYKKK